MVRIKLKTKFLGIRCNKDNVAEQYFQDTYLDIGYKGKIGSQKWLICITHEEYSKVFLWASILWHSKF